MTFYQELQLNQEGSKKIIKNSASKKERLRHILIYLFKIAITLTFCFLFVALYSMIFGDENSVVGVVVLLCVMVFKNADFSMNAPTSAGLLILFFITMIVCPRAANQFGYAAGFFINLIALIIMMFLGCHNPLMSNQSTIVLGYLLLYGYDVTGKSFRMRIAGLLVGAILTTAIFYRNHKNFTYKRSLKHIFQEFSIHSTRTRWQICLVLCVPAAICISEAYKMPRSMWAGIAVMSVIVPFMSDMKLKVRERIIGNICGAALFFALYFILPPSLYANIGLLGGIGVGFSVNYGWQAVFNTFGALAIATETYGLMSAMKLRVLQNIFGVLFALLFCFLFQFIYYKVTSKKHSNDTVA